MATGRHSETSAFGDGCGGGGGDGTTQLGHANGTLSSTLHLSVQLSWRSCAIRASQSHFASDAPQPGEWMLSHEKCSMCRSPIGFCARQ